MQISTEGLPLIEATSVNQLGLKLAGNALRASYRTEATETAARAICWSAIQGVQKIATGTKLHPLFVENFYRLQEGRQVLNGAVAHREALLSLLGSRAVTNRAAIKEYTTLHPETKAPFRHWQWYGAGLLRVTGSDVLVLEGKVQRWRTGVKEGWVDHLQFGALAPLSALDMPRRPMRALPLEIYDTLEMLPTDVVHTGNIGEFGDL